MKKNIINILGIIFGVSLVILGFIITIFEAQTSSLIPVINDTYTIIDALYSVLIVLSIVILYASGIILFVRCASTFITSWFEELK